MLNESHWHGYDFNRTIVGRVVSWVSYLLLAVALLATVILPLLRFIVEFLTPPCVGRPSWWMIGRAITLSALLACPSLLLEAAIALHLGPLLRASRAGLNFMLCFCAPLFFGPTVCALLWKVLVDPNNGVGALVSGMIGVPFPDWSQNAFSAQLVIVALQVWTWGLVGGVGVAALFGRDAQNARALYLLDGGKIAFADLWALWSTRREWMALLLVALSVENLRAFESIHVLTSGGPGTFTSTLAYRVFETGFLNTSNPGTAGSQAMWVWLLIVLNFVVSCLIYLGLKRGGRALEKA